MHTDETLRKIKMFCFHSQLNLRTCDDAWDTIKFSTNKKIKNVNKQIRQNKQSLQFFDMVKLKLSSDNTIIFVVFFTDNGHHNFISWCNRSRCIPWSEWFSWSELLLHTKATDCHWCNYFHCRIFRLLWCNQRELLHGVNGEYSNLKIHKSILRVAIKYFSVLGLNDHHIRFGTISRHQWLCVKKWSRPNVKK